jgi:hypothetical protein
MRHEGRAPRAFAALAGASAVLVAAGCAAILDIEDP